MRPLRHDVLARLLALGVAVAVMASCGRDDSPRATDAPPGTIGLGDGIDPLEQPDDGSGGTPTSPLGAASSCAARVDGDLRQQFVSPTSMASVRTDRWLSIAQIAQFAAASGLTDPAMAPLDGWLAMSCTLPNGDTITARTADDTTIDRLPMTPATYAVAPGVPTGISIDDPGGGATWSVLATLDGALFAPSDGGQAIVTTFDGDEVVVTVQVALVEVEPAGAPRQVVLDASFRASCGAPYEGCAS